MVILLDMKFQFPNRCIFIELIFADPDLQVISGGLGEGLAEIRRVVELAAVAVEATSIFSPEVVASVTEIVISHKRWYNCRWQVTTGTACTDRIVTVSFSSCIGE